jgi:hypothetical protein
MMETWLSAARLCTVVCDTYRVTDMAVASWVGICTYCRAMIRAMCGIDVESIVVIAWDRLAVAADTIAVEQRLVV